MEALITGANGFLGSALGRRLVGNGHRVRALVRPGSDASRLDGAGVQRVSGDVTDPGSLVPAVEGVGCRLPPRGAAARPRALGLLPGERRGHSHRV